MARPTKIPLVLSAGFRLSLWNNALPIPDCLIGAVCFCIASVSSPRVPRGCADLKGDRFLVHFVSVNSRQIGLAETSGYQACTARIEGAAVFPSITFTFNTTSIFILEKSFFI